MKRALKLIGGIAVLLVAALVIVVNYSEKIERFDCTDGADRRIALEIKEYRWWVQLWSDEATGGNVTIQSPDLREFAYFPRVNSSGGIVFMNDSASGKGANFFRLTRDLHIDFGGADLVKARCVAVLM